VQSSHSLSDDELRKKANWAQATIGELRAQKEDAVAQLMVAVEDRDALIREGEELRQQVEELATELDARTVRGVALSHCSECTINLPCTACTQHARPCGAHR